MKRFDHLIKKKQRDFVPNTAGNILHKAGQLDKPADVAGDNQEHQGIQDKNQTGDESDKS